MALVYAGIRRECKPERALGGVTCATSCWAGGPAGRRAGPADAYLYCAHGRVRARPMARVGAACQGAIYSSAGSTRLRARPVGGAAGAGPGGSPSVQGSRQAGSPGSSGRQAGRHTYRAIGHVRDAYGWAAWRSRSDPRAWERGRTTGRPDDRTAPSSQLIRTASARPSTHRQVRWWWEAGGRGRAPPSSTRLTGRPFEHGPSRPRAPARRP